MGIIRDPIWVYFGKQGHIPGLNSVVSNRRVLRAFLEDGQESIPGARAIKTRVFPEPEIWIRQIVSSYRFLTFISHETELIKSPHEWLEIISEKVNQCYCGAQIRD
jgi:hypothetical protein